MDKIILGAIVGIAVATVIFAFVNWLDIPMDE